MNNKFRYLYNNIALFTLANFGTKILSFLFVGIYTNILTTAEYGMVSLITTTAGLIAPFLTLNIAAAVQRFAFDDNYDKKSVFSVGIIALLVGNVFVVLVCAIMHSMHLFGWPVVAYLFVGLFVSSSALNEVQLNFARAIDIVPVIVTASLLSTMTTIASNVILLVYVKLGVLGYLISAVAGTIVSIIYVSFRAKLWKYIVIKDGGCKLYKEMIHYSGPLVFNSVGWWVVMSSDRLFINAMLGSSENGIYSMSGKLSDILMTGLSIFNQAWAISALKESNNLDERESFYSRIYKSISGVVFMLSSIIIIFINPMAKYLFKNDFYVAWKYAGLLLLACGFNGLSSSLGAVFDVMKNTKAYAYSTMVAALLNVVLNACLIPRYHIYGAVIATDISFFAVWLIRYCLAKKYMDLHLNTFKYFVLLIVLLTQIVISLTESHMYLGQLALMLVIFAMLYKDMEAVFRTLFEYFRSILGRFIK